MKSETCLSIHQYSSLPNMYREEGRENQTDKVWVFVESSWWVHASYYVILSHVSNSIKVLQRHKECKHKQGLYVAKVFFMKQSPSGILKIRAALLFFHTWQDIFKRQWPCHDQCSSVGWAPSHKAKRCQFDSRSGHMPGLQACSQSRLLIDVSLTHRCFFLPLFLPPFPSLRINK